MSDRIRKIKRGNFIAEVAFSSTLLLLMITIFCIIFIDGGEFGGPWSYVLGGLIASYLLICLFGFSVSMAARKQGIKYLPNLGDYLHGHRD
jgi:hypothetical protein